MRREARGLTPVFGTAQPLSGLSGMLRRAAYRIPEHEARRWLLLLFADRMEAYGRRVGLAAAVRARPLLAATVATGVGLLAGAARTSRGAARPRWTRATSRDRPALAGI